MHRLLLLAVALHWLMPELWSTSCRPPVLCTLVRADVIFTGVAVEQWDRTTRFRVERMFKGGNGAATVDIVRDFEAYFTVSVGESYLVFARSEDGRLYASDCGGVWNLSRASEPLRYLEEWQAGNTPTQVIGHLTLRDGGGPEVYRQFRRVARLAPLEVVAEDGTRIRAQTDARGTFAVTVPQPGRYRISAAIPRWVNEPAAQEVLAPERGCVMTRLEVRPDCQVTGRAIAANGAAAPGVTLSMLALDEPGSLRGLAWYAVTDAQGRFAFRGVFPGRYHVGVNPGGSVTPKVPYKPTVYTDAADGKSPATINVGWFEKVALGVLRLPPRLGTRTIRVTVTTPDGQPLPGGTVSYAEERRRRSFGVLMPNPTGTVAFDTLSGLGYIVTVRPLNRELKQFRVAPGRETAELRVALDKP